MAAIGPFLRAVLREADHRGYNFDRLRIRRIEFGVPTIEVTDGQLSYEFLHLPE